MSLSFKNENNIHPMLTQDYAIYTPPIAHLFEVICEWVENKVPGGYIYGVSRLGKSRAIRFWFSQLIEDKYHGKVLFFYMNYKEHQFPTENMFITELLGALDHLFSQSGTKAAKYDRLINHMCTRAQNLQSNHILLMIDEAQFMHDQEYKWLCNIQNDMDNLGYRFTVISVGSHELTYQHEVFSMAESAYLLSRFMVRSEAFHGIQSLAELEYVLEGYDKHSEWPENTGISFTQHFFPRAFRSGFRIAEIAEDMWTAFIELAPSTLQNRLEIPMEHIAKSIEYIFRQLNSSDSLHIQIEKSLIIKAIKQTAYQQHMQAISLILGRKQRPNV